MKQKKLEFLIVSHSVIFQRDRFRSFPAKVSAQTDCDLDCLGDKVAALTRRVAALEKSTGKTTTVAKKAKESFLQISGGSAVGGDWTKVPGTEFWFDQSLYGEVTVVTWGG